VEDHGVFLSVGEDMQGEVDDVVGLQDDLKLEAVEQVGQPVRDAELWGVEAHTPIKSQGRERVKFNVEAA